MLCHLFVERRLTLPLSYLTSMLFYPACAVSWPLPPLLQRLKVAIGSILGVIIQITSGINGGRYWQLVAGKIVVCASIGE